MIHLLAALKSFGGFGLMGIAGAGGTGESILIKAKKLPDAPRE